MIFTETELIELLKQGQKVKVGEISKENFSTDEIIKLDQYLTKRSANPFRLLQVAQIEPIGRNESTR
jgi:type II secretory pathway predicted ATPase ExeA